MFNYAEFMDNYVKPSYRDYLFVKFANPPSFQVGIYISNHYGPEAMNIEEYQKYALLIDEEAADRVLRSRAKTAFAWFLSGVWHYLARVFTLSYNEFCASHYENALNDAIYADDPH